MSGSGSQEDESDANPTVFHESVDFEEPGPEAEFISMPDGGINESIHGVAGDKIHRRISNDSPFIAIGFRYVPPMREILALEADYPQ